MAQVAGFGGQELVLRGGGERFVVPSDMRNAITLASNERILCLGKHESWPCLVGFGKDRVATFEAILDEQRDEAKNNGQSFDRALRKARLWSFKPHTFDSSGRFVLQPASAKLGQIEDRIYFHGVGDVITLWNPDVLMAQGDEFDFFKVYCEQEMADLAAKGKGK